MSLIEELISVTGSEALGSKKLPKWARYLALGLLGAFLAALIIGGFAGAVSRGDALGAIAVGLCGVAVAVMLRMAIHRIYSEGRDKK